VLVAAALSNADYAGLAFVWTYDLRRRRFLELEQLAPLAVGVRLGETVDEAAEFESRSLRYRWEPQTLGGERGIAVTVSAPRTKGNDAPFELRLRISRRPADEGLNLVVPWSDTRFNYTSKLVALPAEGELLAGGERYPLAAAETLASIDCTRGLWPYRTTWHWASGAGYVRTAGAARRIGLNFGDGWTDGTGTYENALYIDGRVLPLWEPIRFSFNPRALQEPWTLRTVESDRVALQFTPCYDRKQNTNLGLVQMKLEQVMGHFAGQIRGDNGETLHIDHLPGIAENHLARW